ncbi:MAG: DEAD/DEAH box helicase family protein [Anaerolineae bacterium]|nr:DEAD/DEAH box helicase family protein [Anaerolineae bacterium]
MSAPYTGNQTVFLSGPPGSGKTTLAVRRLLYLLKQGIPAEQMLVLVPQRTLAGPYYQAIHSTVAPAGSLVDVATIGGLARRTIELFWPLVSEAAGFARPNDRPRFLTLETAQYYMDRIVEPFVAAGAFDGITIPRARLVSQIIDDLNKAAAVGFSPDEISSRLKGAWGGDSSRLRIYDQVQAVALAFRRACLEQNVLDWSLQIDVFWHHLLPLPQFRRYLLSGYRHLIVDNTEEDIPASHDLLRLWLPLCESALVIHDTNGGYRVFLGADPQGALALATLCRDRRLVSRSYAATPEVAALGAELAGPFLPKGDQSPDWDLGRKPAGRVDASQALGLPEESIRFHHQMLDWVAGEISRLTMEEGVQPGEIAILAPFVSDALRFSLAEALTRYHIPVRTHRPSRELREEPAARCLLTLAKLAHPGWRRPPPPADVAQCLAMAIVGLDPVRAHLLTGIVYRIKDGQPALTPFHQIVPEAQERISYLLGGRYDELWRWLAEALRSKKVSNGVVGGTDDGAEAVTASETDGADGLDHFLSRLFGEILSQPGFGFHRDFDAGAVAANLIESVQKFRQTFPPSSVDRDREVEVDVSIEYVDMVERGVVAAQYVSSWQVRPEDAVLLVPAYTFLMMNQPVAIQFWLDAGSQAWFERIYQPLTHPYVLRRDWPEAQVWTDDDEVRVRQEALVRLILGLTRRCRRRIYLASSALSEQGYEQQGPLLQSVQRLLRRGGEPRRQAGGTGVARP